MECMWREPQQTEECSRPAPIRLGWNSLSLELERAELALSPLLLQREGPCGFSLSPNAGVVRFLQENAADNKRHAGHNHRVIKPGINIAGGRHGRQSNERQQPSKDSVSYMVRQRNGSVPNLRRESLDQVRGDWSIHQGHVENLQEN